MRLSILLLVTAVLAGCGQEPAPAVDPDLVPAAYQSLADYQTQHQAVLDDLARAVGGAEATDIASCRVVETGVQHCGNPAGALVYSTEGTDVDEVRRLGALLVALDEVANEQYGDRSGCIFYREPPVVLREGRCQVDMERAATEALEAD